jgi:hypothetical protein
MKRQPREARSGAGMLEGQPSPSALACDWGAGSGLIGGSSRTFAFAETGNFALFTV